MDVDQIKLEVIGRWAGIFDHLGIEVSSRHITCPLCGREKFRCDDKGGQGTWICTCGAGDGWRLVQETQGLDFMGAVALVAPLLGVVEERRVNGKKKGITPAMARKIFLGAVRSDRGNMVGQYLAGRGLRACPETLWYHPAMPHTHEGRDYPAMLAVISNRAGDAVALHRTYLDAGAKARIKEPRMVTPNITGKDLIGKAIRLYPPEEKCLGVAEGIETALACYELHGIPTWATTAANLLIGWEPPEKHDLRKVYVFGDNDGSYTGQSAAYQLAHKLKVRRRMEVEVLIPGEAGDWLDELGRRRQ